MTACAYSAASSRRLVAVLSAGARRAAVTPTRRQCQSLRADRTVATKVATAPAKGAPRVFAMQVKLDANQVRAMDSFALKVECLLRERVLPHRAKGRPNVVLFDENAGLLAGASGARGAKARRIASNPGADARCRGQAFPCRTLNLLGELGTAYARERRFYATRLKGLDKPSAPFTLATDTIARTFMRAFSDAARRHKLYVVAGNMQAPFRQTARRRPSGRCARRARGRSRSTRPPAARSTTRSSPGARATCAAAAPT